MSGQARNWMFTINNPSESDDVFLERTKTWPRLRFVTFQREQGEQGTPHFQGYVEFTGTYRLEALKRLDPKAHWEQRRGSQKQAVEYCNKADTRLSGPYTFGEAATTTQGARNDLTDTCRTLRVEGIKACRAMHPETWVKYHRGLRDIDLASVRQTGEAPAVHLLFGPPGCGKTRSFYDLEGDDGCHIICSGGFWFDGYEGDSAVLLDDFDGRASRWTLAQTLNCLDRYQVRLPIKGGFVRWRPKRIYVSTNVHPREWFDWSSREQQYPALKRRFTEVRWWKQPDAQPLALTPTHPEWEHFWKHGDGPRGGYMCGDTMRVENTVDYFDF